MEFHRGRLFDHVQLVVSNLEASKRFYKAVLASLGHADAFVDGPKFFYADELFVSESEPFKTADFQPKLSHVHIAFQAESQDAVKRFHKAALEAGGSEHGAPGERHYHPGYYAAFVLDPDGNNVEAVFHGPFTRSAASVVLTPTDMPGADKK